MRSVSRVDSSASSAFDKPVEATQPTVQTARACREAAFAEACAYPATAPNRAVFLATRALIIVFGIAEIILAVVAQQSINRDQWMAPILSPAITSACASFADIYFVVTCCRRSHPLTRFLYDGAIGVGFAIAGGFLVSFTLGDLTRSDPTSTSTTAAVGGSILFCMFSSMLLQFGISVAGGKQWFRLRRERRLASSPA